MILTVGNQNKHVAKSLKTKTWMIMKLTIALLLFFTFQVSAKSDAQKITIVKNNIHLSEVFRNIEKQTGYLFFYDKALIKNTDPIDISIKDATIDQALSACLKSEHLTYSIVRNTVVIQPLKVSSPQVQNISIIDIANIVKGKVTNSKGEPLAGVSITVKGKTIGTTTDGSGNYSIDAPRNATLVFSNVGFVIREIAVNNQLVINGQPRDLGTLAPAQKLTITHADWGFSWNRAITVELVRADTVLAKANARIYYWPMGVILLLIVAAWLYYMVRLRSKQRASNVKRIYTDNRRQRDILDE